MSMKDREKKNNTDDSRAFEERRPFPENPVILDDGLGPFSFGDDRHS